MNYFASSLVEEYNHFANRAFGTIIGLFTVLLLSMLILYVRSRTRKSDLLRSFASICEKARFGIVDLSDEKAAEPQFGSADRFDARRYDDILSDRESAFITASTAKLIKAIEQLYLEIDLNRDHSGYAVARSRLSSELLQDAVVQDLLKEIGNVCGPDGVLEGIFANEEIQYYSCIPARTEKRQSSAC
jgi:hypothetical protein